MSNQELETQLSKVESPMMNLSNAFKELKQFSGNDIQLNQLLQVLSALNPKINDISEKLSKAVKSIKNGDNTSETDNLIKQVIESEFFTSNNYYGGIKDYLYLNQYGKIQAQYVWIGGTGLDMRCKTRTLNKIPYSVKDLPNWNYDGSSTGQAEGRYSEVWLRPVKYIKDPFRRGNNIIVLCETLDAKTMTPHPSNRRGPAMKIFENQKVIDEEPWYGIEQEYTMFEQDGITPLGWPKNGFPGAQGYLLYIYMCLYIYEYI